MAVQLIVRLIMVWRYSVFACITGRKVGDLNFLFFFWDRE